MEQERIQHLEFIQNIINRMNSNSFQIKEWMIMIVSADSIYVGKDVTNDKVQGCVTLGLGQITLKAKSVIVKNSTSVPLGTTLNIENK